MYEKFDTCIEKQINKNSYFDEKFFVEKEIITTWLFHPYYNRLFTIKFHFAKITKKMSKPKILKTKTGEPIHLLWWSLEYYKEQFLKIKKEITLSDEDLTEELNIYCPDPELKGYMIIEVYYKDKLQPPYFAFTFFPEIISFLTFSINKRNFETFKKVIKIKLEEHLKNEIILPSTFVDFFKIAEQFGDLIGEYKQFKTGRFKSPLYGDIKKEINNFRKFIFNDKADQVFSCFLVLPFLIFLQLLKHDKEFLQCEQCGQIIKYAKDKKYCSLKTDGQGCAKKARNKRTYLKNKLNN